MINLGIFSFNRYGNTNVARHGRRRVWRVGMIDGSIVVEPLAEEKNWGIQERAGIGGYRVIVQRSEAGRS